MPIGDEGWGNAATGAANLVTNTMNSFGPVKSSNTLMAEAGTSTGYGSGFTYQRQDPVNSAAQMSELSQETTSNALKTAAAGASLGATFGPIGAGIGVVAGGVLGLIGGAARKRKLINEMKDAKIKTGYVNEFNLASGQSDFLESDYNTKYNTTQHDQLLTAKNGKEPGCKLALGLEPNAMVSNGEIIGHVDNFGNVIDAMRVGHGKDNKDTIPVHLAGGKQPSDNSFVITNKHGISDYVAATGDVEGGLQMQKNMKGYQRYKQLWNGRIPELLIGGYRGGKLPKYENGTLPPELKKRFSFMGAPQKQNLVIEDINNMPGAFYNMPRDKWQTYGYGKLHSISNEIPPVTDVDTRSDTTRRGQHEGQIPWGAGNGPAGQGPLELLEVGPGMTNPNLQYGEAPGIGLNPKSVLKGLKKGLKNFNRMGGMQSYDDYVREAEKYGSGFWNTRPGMSEDPNIIGQMNKREEMLGNVWKAQKKKELIEDLGVTGALGYGGYKEYKKNYKCGKLPKYAGGENPIYTVPDIQNVVNTAKMYQQELGGNSFIKTQDLMPKAEDWEVYKRLIGGTTDGSIDDYIRKQDDYDDNIGSKRTSPWLPATLGALGIATAYQMMPKGDPYAPQTNVSNPYEQQIRSIMAKRRPNSEAQYAAMRDAEARGRVALRKVGTSIGAYLPAAIAQNIGLQRNWANALGANNDKLNQLLGEQANMDYQLGHGITQRGMNSNQFLANMLAKSASNDYNLRNNVLAQMLGQGQWTYKTMSDIKRGEDLIGLYNRDYALRRDELNRRAIA